MLRLPLLDHNFASLLRSKVRLWHLVGKLLTSADPSKPTYLRVARTGQEVSVSYSFDGKEWSAPYAHRKYEFPDEVTVGVFLAQSTYQVADATFAEFVLEKSAKK